MQLYSIITNEYDADIEKLLKRRLEKHELDTVPLVSEKTAPTRQKVTVGIESGELCAFSAAAAELLFEDMRYFVIANMVDRLPFSLDEKQRILPSAIHLSYSGSNTASADTALFEYLSCNDILNIEGYIRFRMRDVLEDWSVCADAAAQAFLLEESCRSLSEILGIITAAAPRCGGDVLVILNPDGSCTISDPDAIGGSAGFRLDCSPDCTESVLNILAGLKPKRITLYDFSFGRCEKLRKAIESLFGESVTEDK